MPACSHANSVPGAAEARHDLVGDEKDIVLRAELARAAQVVGVVHRHARRALHQRLDDQRGGGGVMRGEVRRQGVRGARRRFARRFSGPRGRRFHDRVPVQERRVGVAKERNVGDGERAERLAVIAPREARELDLLRNAAVAPIVEGHLQRDLGRRCAVGCIEGVPQSRRRRGGEALGQLDDAAMRAAREDHVLESPRAAPSARR